MEPAPITGRQKAVTKVIGVVLTSLSAAGRLHPVSRSWRDGIELYRDVPYVQGYGRPQHLDVYRPARRDGPLPVLLYIHGGGFSLLSKSTHWMFGYGFARQGYLVFSIDYTLSGEAPFPAALRDAAAALAFVQERAAFYGGDPARIALAGESAGANLALALTVAQCWERPEPYAADVFARAGEYGPVRAVLPACGMLQVSDPERYLRDETLPAWIRDRIAVVCRRYLPDASGDPDSFALADPLCVLESDAAPARPLPPILAVCGDRDPVQDDSRRLDGALRERGNAGGVRWYPGGIHAFHAFIWQEGSRAAWDDQLRFLREWMD